jgi:hypothetical protein
MQLVNRWNVPRVLGSGLLVVSNRDTQSFQENTHPVDDDRMLSMVPGGVHGDVTVIIMYEEAYKRSCKRSRDIGGR